MAMQNSDVTVRARAARYPIEAAVSYRVAGGGWLDGRSMNVSDSGLLFTTTNPILAADVHIDVRVRLSGVARGAAALPGWARVVRGRFGEAPALSVMAVAFGRSELEPAAAPVH